MKVLKVPHLPRKSIKPEVLAVVDAFTTAVFFPHCVVVVFCLAVVVVVAAGVVVVVVVVNVVGGGGGGGGGRGAGGAATKTKTPQHNVGKKEHLLGAVLCCYEPRFKLFSLTSCTASKRFWTCPSLEIHGPQLIKYHHKNPHRYTYWSYSYI